MGVPEFNKLALIAFADKKPDDIAKFRAALQARLEIDLGAKIKSKTCNPKNELHLTDFYIALEMRCSNEISVITRILSYIRVPGKAQHYPYAVYKQMIVDIYLHHVKVAGLR